MQKPKVTKIYSFVISSVFIVFVFTFISMNHCKLFFNMAWSINWRVFFVLNMDIQLFQNHLLKTTSFLSCLCTVLKMLFMYAGVNFWTLYLVSLCYMAIFMSVLQCLDWGSCILALKYLKYYSLTLLFIKHFVLVILDIFHFI